MIFFSFKKQVQKLKMIKLQKGFTLYEMLVAVFIFASVSIIAGTIFMNIVTAKKKINLEFQIYSEARFIMEKLVREVRRNTIDYEEYYNQYILSTPIHSKNFGDNYGKYAQSFYNLGTDGKAGALCNDKNLYPSCVDSKKGIVLDQTTLDKNLGKNPAIGIWNDATSICEKGVSGRACKDPIYQSNFWPQNIDKELYLINPSGTQKTIFARENFAKNSTEYALSILKLKGEDTTKDNIPNNWTCSEDFTCPLAGNIPDRKDLIKSTSSDFVDNQNFVPITPSTVSIKNISFIISPLEDPFKAFKEQSSDIQIHPHVTIILTLEPSTELKQNYPGSPPEITIQTTVSSRVYNEVKSYISQ